ncbi:MAG: hypothetical protein J7647_17940 [Cyanobacteria bacterium SBLK]|nr:hypothetical protein [Cyanobacteria bacterium SBLK]
MNVKRVWQWLGMALVTTLLVVGTGDRSSAGVTVEALQTCIPDWNGFFARSEIVGSTQYEGKEYVLLHLYQPDTPFPDPLVVSRPVGGGDCTQEFLDISGSDVSLAEVLGEREIGRQLTLALYRGELERLGREGLQQQVNEAAEGENAVEWWDEEVWALRQLGIEIPSNVVVKGGS